MPPLKFIGVPDLLADVGEGIGRAGRSVFHQSMTPVGVLVVKDAQIDVSFEMSTSSVTRDSTLGVGALGAKTLSFGTRTFDESQTNRCSIHLNVVSIAPPEEDARPLALGETGIVPEDAAGINQLAKKLSSLIRALALSPALKSSLSKGIDEVVLLVKANQPVQARQALLRFIGLHVRS